MAKRERRKRRERRLKHAGRSGLSVRQSVITGAGVTAGAVLGIAAPAMGAYYEVNQGGDAGDGTCETTPGECTLRDAVDDANDNPGYDGIYFQPTLTGTITLGSQIPITDGLYIYNQDGPGDLTISGNNSSRIFDVDPASGDYVSFIGLTLADGNVTGNGGAIQNYDGILTIVNSVLSGNTASGDGGAVYEAGAYNYGRDDIFVTTTFTDNDASYGGAIAAPLSWGFLGTTTFSGNDATAYGGGVHGYFGRIYDSTVSGNGAGGAGGGINAYEVFLLNDIFANNTAGANPDLNAAWGYAAFDLVEDPGALDFSGNPSIITGQDPQLGALGDNGGETPTLKPAPGSPVVDQGLSYANYDQRGFERTVDNPNRANAAYGSDIGAVELTLAEGPQAGASAPPVITPSPTFNLKKAIRRCKRKFPKGPKRKRCIRKAKKRARAQFRFGTQADAAPSLNAAGERPFSLGGGLPRAQERRGRLGRWAENPEYQPFRLGR